MKINKKHALGSVLTLILANPAYAAINCATPPTCADLGYADTKSSCTGKWLPCPMDSTKTKGLCVATSYSCADMGYYRTVADCTGRPYLVCPSDETKAFCDCNGEREEFYNGKCVVCNTGKVPHNGTCYIDKQDLYGCGSLDMITASEVDGRCEEAYHECSSPEFYWFGGDDYQQCYPEVCKSIASCETIYGLLEIPAPLRDVLSERMLAMGLGKNIGVRNISEEDCRQKYATIAAEDSDFAVYEA